LNKILNFCAKKDETFSLSILKFGLKDGEKIKNSSNKVKYLRLTSFENTLELTLKLSECK